MIMLVLDLAAGLHGANFPKGYLNQLVHPFTRSPFDDDLQVKGKTNR
jgi:hypothetical protein